MTDLQTSLIVIGAVIVGGVIGYNKWHEFRARKHVERAFSTPQDDVLMKPAAKAPAPKTSGTPVVSRQEPVFDDHEKVSASDEGAELADEAGQEPVLAEDTPKAVPLPIDDQIDCVIPLSLEVPVRGEKLLPLLQSLRHVGSKPVHYMGLIQGTATSQPAWQPIVHGTVYTDLQAGVQLASRAGALNELEYSELIVRLRQIADEIAAEPDIPDMAAVMQSARSLYQFVSDHDARLGLSIRSNGVPWAVNTLLVVLERHGFDVRPDGRFVMPDSEGGVLFSLTTNEPVTAEHASCITLLLDVPRIAAEQNGFGAMLECARTLANRLNGTIVDDGKQSLSNAALDEIAQQVQSFYDEMQTAGIPAGSTRALRLFN